MKYLSFFLITIALLSPCSADAGPCYSPDGIAYVGIEWLKCHGTANPDGMCCLDDQHCLSNGLCQNDSDKSYWRGLCEEPSSSDCLNVCTGGDVEEPFARMTPCDGTSGSKTWCCGNTTSCCETKSAVTLRKYFFDENRTVTTTMTTSASATTTPSESSQTESSQTETAQTETAQAEPSSGLSTGGKAGAGVGGALGGIAIIGGLGFFLLRQRRRKTPDITAPRVELASPK